MGLNENGNIYLSNVAFVQPKSFIVPYSMRDEPKDFLLDCSVHLEMLWKMKTLPANQPVRPETGTVLHLL